MSTIPFTIQPPTEAEITAALEAPWAFVAHPDARYAAAWACAQSAESVARSGGMP